MHTTIAELVKEVIDEVAFSELKSQEQRFLEEVDHDRVNEYIEKLIGRQGDIRSILRLICLQSQVGWLLGSWNVIIGSVTGWQRTQAKGIRALQERSRACLRRTTHSYILQIGMCWSVKVTATSIKDLFHAQKVSSIFIAVEADWNLHFLNLIQQLASTVT